MKGLIEALASFILIHSYCNGTVGEFGHALVLGLSYMLIIGGLRTYANPAIHFGKAFGGTLGWVDAFWFFLCQVGGAFGGTIMNNVMFNATPNIFGMSGTVTQVMTLVYFEGLYATVICLITLRADDNSTEKDEAKDQATAIAAAYAVGHYIFGAKTGGIFNPAIAFGNAVGTWTRSGTDTAAGIEMYDFLWVHILAPYAGAFLSALILWLGSDKYGIFWDKKGNVDIDA